MSEQFTNNAASTLAEPIRTAVQGFCKVASAASFPASGNFRIKVDAEILIVTAVAGTVFTITRGVEGTTAATHAAGASVVHLITKGSLEARIADRFVRDLYANKPAAGLKGRVFFPADGLFIEYDDGAAWHKFGPYKRLIPPPQTGWSWVNQNNATATFTPGGVLVLEDPDLDASATNDVRLYVRPIKQLPATITMAFLWNGVTTTSPVMGLCARSSGGAENGQFTTMLIGPLQGSPPQLWHKLERYYASPTSTEGGGQATRMLTGSPQRLFWFRMSLQGSQKFLYFSMDGVNWLQQSSYGLYDGSTPNQWGIFIDQQDNGQKVSMSLVHWEES